MRDNDCSGISRRGLLGASSAMLALGLAAPLTRTMAAGADSGAEASATVPSLKGKRIAISLSLIHI